MWNKPTDKQLAKLPVFYSREHVALKDKLIQMHFFLTSSDWYVVEYDADSRNFFGFVILNNDYEMAEWGYFSLDELMGLKSGYIEVDRDLHFKPKKASEVGSISKAQRF